MVPEAVLARLGASVIERSRFGSARVLHGNGLVLKMAAEDRIARETVVLAELAGTFPIRLPSLVQSGSGWLLLRFVDAVEPDDLTSWRSAALRDLAELHNAFAGAPVLADGRLRDLLGRELPALLERCAELATELDLPEPLRLLAADPAPLCARLGDEVTLVHGGAWPGNVLSTADGGRCWIDWEEAGAGHPALDLANWLHGSPWVPASPDPDGDLALYLAARRTAFDEMRFRRSIDAAVVLLFLLLDLPGIAGWQERERRDIIACRTATAQRFVGSSGPG